MRELATLAMFQSGQDKKLFKQTVQCLLIAEFLVVGGALVLVRPLADAVYLATILGGIVFVSVALVGMFFVPLFRRHNVSPSDYPYFDIREPDSGRGHEPRPTSVVEEANPGRATRKRVWIDFMSRKRRGRKPRRILKPSWADAAMPRNPLRSVVLIILIAALAALLWWEGLEPVTP